MEIICWMKNIIMYGKNFLIIVRHIVDSKNAKIITTEYSFGMPIKG